MSASLESAGSMGALADARASDTVHRVTSAREESAGSTRVVKCAMSVAAGGSGENQLSFIGTTRDSRLRDQCGAGRLRSQQFDLRSPAQIGN